MATTRKQDLKAMVATLETWAGQIADLEAKARTAGMERRRVMSAQIVDLRQRRWAYEVQMADTSGSTAAVFRDMQAAAARMAEEFRKLYLTTASRFSE